MKIIKDLEPSLPLTFQKAVVHKNNPDSASAKVVVKYIGTKAMSPTRFYRPISKIIAL